MSSTLDLFAIACKKNDWPTPYAAAKVMGISKETIYTWIKRNGTADDPTVMTLCEHAGEDAAVWVPLIHAERAKVPAVKKLWKSIADKAARAAAVVLAVFFLALPHPGNSGEITEKSTTFNNCILC